MKVTDLASLAIGVYGAVVATLLAISQGRRRLIENTPRLRITPWCRVRFPLDWDLVVDITNAGWHDIRLTSVVLRRVSSNEPLLIRRLATDMPRLAPNDVATIVLPGGEVGRKLGYPMYLIATLVGVSIGTGEEFWSPGVDLGIEKCTLDVALHKRYFQEPPEVPLSEALNTLPSYVRDTANKFGRALATARWREEGGMLISGSFSATELNIGMTISAELTKAHELPEDASGD